MGRWEKNAVTLPTACIMHDHVVRAIAWPKQFWKRKLLQRLVLTSNLIYHVFLITKTWTSQSLVTNYCKEFLFWGGGLEAEWERA